MTNLKKNINHYMERKGIRFYSDLLVDIAHQLNIKGQAAYDFAEREKANFSKMLKGERPLKYEFIIPLEKIFGVSLARMLDEDAYKLPVDRDNVPIVKGFRYYAYVDDYDLYNKELDLYLTKESTSCLTCMDEFGKTFLDYVVEYGSKNAVRFLRDKYNIKMRFHNNQFISSLKNASTIFTHNGIEFARLVASIGDTKLFNDIYDSYYFITQYDFFPENIIWCQPDFQEIILDNKDIFESMFERKKYDYELSPKAQKRLGLKNIEFSTISPMINLILRYALNNLKRYKEQAIDIIKYGIGHNQRVKDGLTIDIRDTSVDECGGLRTRKGYELIDVVIVVQDKNIADKDIKELVSKLPTFYNPFYS